MTKNEDNKFEMTVDGFEEAKSYLESIDKYREMNRLDGYSVISAANYYYSKDLHEQKED